MNERPQSGGDPLPVGQRLRNVQTDTFGEVVDCACQYAHPKAPPVYSYLVRWQDGQVEAFTERALDGEFGLELVD